MNAGFATDGVKEGQFVMIDTGNVEDEDNAKLYVKGSASYTYITDLSGATGMTGPQGPQGEQGIQGPKVTRGIQEKPALRATRVIQENRARKAFRALKATKGTLERRALPELTEKMELRQNLRSGKGIYGPFSQMMKRDKPGASIKRCPAA